MGKETFEELRQADRGRPKIVAIVGDTMIDEWVECALFMSQDGCPSSRHTQFHVFPGGAAGCARQFSNWYTKARLLGPANEKLFTLMSKTAPLVLMDRTPLCPEVSIKQRFILPSDKLHYRCDHDVDHYGLSQTPIEVIRLGVVNSLRETVWHALLLVDYEKGLLNTELIRACIAIAQERNAIIVADPKRAPSVFKGAVLKINAAYHAEYEKEVHLHPGPVVSTIGPGKPTITVSGLTTMGVSGGGRYVAPKNHVGAGDCFGAHLTLGLVHGMSIQESAELAHRAGRVYVSRRYGLPPTPEEIEADYEASKGD
jgi:bifunctional ADP-heptose synthase (sugar kinase/adenylyltransferase)